MTNATNAIEAALAAAKAQQALAPIAPQNTAVDVQRGTPGRRLTMDDAQPNMSVDQYLKADIRGLKLGENFFDQAVVTLKLSELQWCRIVKWQDGGAARYARTYDGVVEHTTNLPWNSVIAKAQGIDKNVRGDYPAVDIPMTVSENIFDAKTKKILLAQAGSTIGYTTSTTGHALFMKAANAAKIIHGEDNTFAVMIKAATKKNTKLNSEYAVIDFELMPSA